MDKESKDILGIILVVIIICVLLMAGVLPFVYKFGYCQGQLDATKEFSEKLDRLK